jgi:hypothetical protein
MDTAQKSWVAYFHLIDPIKLARTHDIHRATLLVVGARMQNTIARVVGKSGGDRYRHIDEDVLEMDHRRENHQALTRRATDTNIQHFHYCSRRCAVRGAKSDSRCISGAGSWPAWLRRSSHLGS